jgi:MFS family permease
VTAPTRPGRRVLWWLLVVVFGVGTLASALAKPEHTADDLIAITFGAWGLVGALLAWRRPDNALGWLFLSIGALAGVAGAAGVLTSQPGATVPPAAWYVVLAAWYQQWFWFPTFGISTVLTVLLFPDGLPSRRWRPVLWTAVGSIAVLTVLAAFDPTLSSAATTGSPPPAPLPNPLASPGLPVLGQGVSSPLFLLAYVTLFGCGVAAVFSAVLRYRRSRGVERLQLRWFVFAVAISLVTLVGVVTAGVVGSQGGDDGWAAFAVNVVLNLALAFVPVSCGIAILRYHLYDIDRVVSRTTSYAVVTALVLVVYASVVTLVPRLVPHSSSVAVAAGTLLAAAVARPALRRVQTAVDRRFNRAKVDAQRTVDAFGERLRDEVDTNLVRGDLVVAVDRTLQPATIRLWLRA